MGKPHLVLILYRIDLIVKHLLVGVLPKEHTQSDCRGQTHILQQLKGKLRGKLGWCPVEIRDPISIQDVLEKQREESNEIERWHAISKEKNDDDGDLCDGYSPIEEVFRPGIHF